MGVVGDVKVARAHIVVDAAAGANVPPAQSAWRSGKFDGDTVVGVVDVPDVVLALAKVGRRCGELGDEALEALVERNLDVCKGAAFERRVCV